MNRMISAGVTGAFLLASAGIALAANMPSGTVANASDRNGAEARRMTHSLNLLEAQGYGDFSNFRQDGKNFAATVTRNGRQFTVVVDPDANRVTSQGRVIPSGSGSRFISGSAAGKA